MLSVQLLCPLIQDVVLPLWFPWGYIYGRPRSRHVERKHVDPHFKFSLHNNRHTEPLSNTSDVAPGPPHSNMGTVL